MSLRNTASPSLAFLRRWRPPSLCAVCHDWGTHRVCETCLARFASPLARCSRCAIELPSGVAVCGRCLAVPPAFERTLAALPYAYPWDGLVLRFKFSAGLDLVRVLAQQLAACVQAGDDALPSLVLPVPLALPRLRERGYNQAWELARRVAADAGRHTDARLLLRVRDGPHQLALPADRRAANVRGAFAVEPLRRAELQGRTIALVDDVMTTGATANEAATVLLKAGAASVHVWVLARTPAPDER
ncbi:MAG: ComF family protein [Burkholderiaceae bacterium]